MGRAQRYAGPLLLSLCAICLILQVLVRPAVGIANNGDFPKMAGPVALGPEDSWEAHDHYADFIYNYIADNRYIYNRPFRDAEFLSSEYFFVKLARGLQKIVQPGPHFDIRWLGALHGLFFLLAVGVWIYALPGRWRIFGGLILILVWTDVAYVQYLNSFYMDAAAMIFLVLGVAAGLHVARNRHGRLFPLLMASAVILFAVSKSQHALPALVFIPLFLGLFFWSRDRIARAAWITSAVLVALGARVVVGRATNDYRAIPVYTVVFYRLAPESPDPLRTLQELGLGKNELPFLNTYAYQSQSPMWSLEWTRQFYSRCNYATLVRYYWRHPSVPLRFMYQDLAGPAVTIRPFANLSLDDGFPRDSQARHFTWWTDLRSFLLKHAPWHVIALGLISLAGALWLLFRSPAGRAFAGLVLVVQIVAALELALASLADDAETDRHLMMFHVATELSILLLPLLFAKLVKHRRMPAREAEPSIIAAAG